MIIYGTGNFNRRNQSVVRCGCSNCGRRDYQRSYTSTRFFTLYFIPVIPLGSQKILQECQHCDNAYGLSLGDHKRQIKKDLPKAIAAFEECPSDPEKANELLGAIARTQQTATLKTYAPQIANNFPSNGELLCSLAETCSYLCLDSLADEYFLQSVNADDDAEIAASAEQHMKRKGKTKPTPPNRILQSLPVLIVPGILLFIFGNMLSTALSNRPDSIYLVNGLDQAYEVYVNDKLVQLDPYERIKGNMLHYDLNTIRPVEGSLPIEQQTFNIEGSAFDDTVFIVNPDRAALISWETISYSTNIDPEDDSRFKILTGKVMYAQNGIDYTFIEFPDQISSSSTRDKVFRTRLDLISDTPADDIVASFMQNDMQLELETYLGEVLKFETDDATLIRTGLGLFPADKFDSLAQDHLTARPVEIEWHRAYQDMQKNIDPASTLQMYRKLYEAAPENNQLAYLYGRASDDPTLSETVMRKAADSSRPSGYASYGLSYYYMLEGDFDSTVKYSENASRWIPGNETFNYTRRIGLYGIEDYQTIADEAELTLAIDLDFNALYDFAYANAKLGRPATAIERIDSELQAWQAFYGISDEDVASTRLYFDQAFALSAANKDGLIKIANRGSSPNYKFESHILQGHLYDAIYLASKSPEEFSTNDLLLLSILAKQAGNDDLSLKQLDQAITLLESTEQKDEKQWAKWLSGEPLPEKSKILHTCPDIDQQILLLAALGKSRGDSGTDFVEHAKKLVYQETFYSLALKEAQVF